MTDHTYQVGDRIQFTCFAREDLYRLEAVITGIRPPDFNTGIETSLVPPAADAGVKIWISHLKDIKLVKSVNSDVKLPETGPWDLL